MVKRDSFIFFQNISYYFLQFSFDDFFVEPRGYQRKDKDHSLIYRNVLEKYFPTHAIFPQIGPWIVCVMKLLYIVTFETPWIFPSFIYYSQAETSPCYKTDMQKAIDFETLVYVFNFISFPIMKKVIYHIEDSSHICIIMHYDLVQAICGKTIWSYNSVLIFKKSYQACNPTT